MTTGYSGKHATYEWPKVINTERQRAQDDLNEALIDLRDAERAVERAKQRVEAARCKLSNAETQ